MFSQPFFIPSALIALLSLPLIFGWIPRQSFYGARTSKTLSSDDIWYPANKFAGVVLVASSCIYFAVAMDFSGCNDRYQYWLRDLVHPSWRICDSAYYQPAPEFVPLSKLCKSAIHTIPFVWKLWCFAIPIMAKPTVS